MRDAIDVLIIIALALQILASSAILLGVGAMLLLALKHFRTFTAANSTSLQAPSPQVEKKPVNPCDHCGEELGDPESSRIMSHGTVLIYKCLQCNLPTERQA